jgi:NADPH2:quinone reductase
MKAIRVNQTGGADALRYEDIDAPKPGDGEALVDLKAIGVNFIDVYYRSGLYKANLPFVPGMEGSGTVSAVGSGVTNVRVGDRVAYAMQLGAYAEKAVVPAWKLVKLHDGVDFRQAAATMLQGMTAHYLTHSTFPLKSGQTALIHAGAGGVGLLLTQVAHRLGAKVISTVGSDEKAMLSREVGADEVIVYSRQDFEEDVKRITVGKGVDVVYDSVGVNTFSKSLNCLKPRGYMVLFGQSSGQVPPLDPGLLAAKGSLFLTRPTLANYATTSDEISWRAGDLFKWIAAGDLKLTIGHEFSLADAASAHRELEGRRTTGKVLLTS